LNRISTLLTEACFAYLAPAEFQEVPTEIQQVPNTPPRFPKAHVSPDLEGGLRIEWSLTKGIVTLVVPPEDRKPADEYICYRVNGRSKLLSNLSGRQLAGWLKRLS
jgi:hypothetical protein